MEQTVQEQNKIEHLMRPRYRVIATYPFNDHFMLNEVIELNEYDGREHLAKELNEWFVMQRPLNPQSDRLPLTMHESTFNLYPHLFQRLEWYEERQLEEMPGYTKPDPNGILQNLKDKKIVYRSEWELNDQGMWQMMGEYCFIHASHLLPATEADYLAHPSPQNQEK